MRGLWSVGLTALLAPVFAAPLVPDDIADQEWDQSKAESSTDRVSAHVAVELRGESPGAEKTTVGFQLEVRQSEEACGLGNVRIGGLELPQTLRDDVSTGAGSVWTTTERVVVGAWAFQCIMVNGIPDAQFMKLVIESVDGQAVEGTGFSVLFRQAGLAEIVRIETDLSVSDEVVANPDPRTLQLDEAADRRETEADLADLRSLWGQLREIKQRIREKEHVLDHRRCGQSEADSPGCDGLACLLRDLAHRAQHAVHSVYRTSRKGYGMHGSRRRPIGPWGTNGDRDGYPPPPRDQPSYDGPSPPTLESDRAPPPPASGFYRHPLPGPPPAPAPGHAGDALPRLTLAAGVFLVALLSVALHSLWDPPSDRAARQARRGERRWPADKQPIPRLWAPALSDRGAEREHSDEKAPLADAGDGLSTSMSADISEFRNAAQVVGALVQASLAPEPLAAPLSEAASTMQDPGSRRAGDVDGSGEGGAAADGSRYLPATRCTPSQSRAGSASDLLGADTKS
ncbi:unnamed protein product [Diplocarpon coronariae]